MPATSRYSFLRRLQTRADAAATRAGKLRGMLRCGAGSRLGWMFAVAIVGVALLPSLSSAAPLDSVNATGASAVPQCGPCSQQFSAVQIQATSDPSGANPSGSAAFVVGDQPIYGPVTCLRVTGPDQGGGTSTAPTVAVLNVVNNLSKPGFPDPDGLTYTVELIDNGGSGNDVMSMANIARAPADCSPIPASVDVYTAPLANGRATVIDASTTPTTPTTAKFTASPSPSTVGTAVVFNASSSTCAAAPCEYRWTDGTAVLGSGSLLTYTFHYVGIKHVELTVTDSLGGTSSIEHDLQVSRWHRPRHHHHRW